jgi:hypothetical protein
MKSKLPVHKSPSDAPPGTRAHEAAKGAPKKPPTALPSGFIDGNPKGGQYLAAPHGIVVKDNRSKSTR